MIRVLHTADIHIGVESYGAINPDSGLSTRLEDFLAALDQAVDTALEEDVSCFLVCGDAYRSREPSQTHQRELARRIVRLSRQGIVVFLLVGNHDLPGGVGRATAVEIFSTLELANVHVAAQPALHRVETRHGPLQVLALPWPRRGAFLPAAQGEFRVPGSEFQADTGGSREPATLNAEPETRNSELRSMDDINRRIELWLHDFIQREAEGLDPQVPAILAAHVTVRGFTFGSERQMMVGQDHMLSPSSLQPPGIDYVALGHLHKHQDPGGFGGPPLVYPGSLQPVDFGEEGQEKGFYLVDLDPTLSPGRRCVSHEFRPVHSRPFLTIEVDAAGPDPTGAVLRAIRRRGEAINGAIVRVNAHLDAGAESQLDERAVRQALQPAHHVAAIARDVQRPVRPRLGGAGGPAGISPMEALRRYLELAPAYAGAPERADQLIGLARQLMDRLAAED